MPAAGELFSIRPIYQDGTDRPGRYENGAQDGEEMIVEVFANNGGLTVPMRTSIMRQSTAFPMAATIVEECLDPASGRDAVFARAWRSGLASLNRAEQSAVAGVTGHVAESVIYAFLDSLGQVAAGRPGGHVQGLQ